MQHISIFDLDQTLFAVNSSFRFGLYLCEKKIFTRLSLLYIVGCNIRHKLGFLSIPKLHEESFKRLLLGRSLVTLKQLAKQFVAEYFEKLIYLPAYEKFQQAKKEGHLTIILSSSPDFLVSQIAERFGVDKWQATTYAFDENQRFSTISKLMQGEDKALYIQNLLTQLGLNKKSVTAYSDSYLDLPFLLAAGTAVGVSPDRKLRAYCKQNRWSVI